MGNQSEKDIYLTVSNSVVQCEDFCETLINSEVVNVEKTLKMLTKSINEATNITADIFKDYDDSIILDFYQSYEAIKIFKNNNEKAIQLAQLLPPNRRKLMFKYFNIVPVELIIVMAENINFNLTNDNNETFLFQKLKAEYSMQPIVLEKYFEYICRLLENVTTIDVNICNKNYRTFFDSLIENKYIRGDNMSIKLIQLLEKRNYNFNKMMHYSDTCLTRMLAARPSNAFNFADII